MRKIYNIFLFTLLLLTACGKKEKETHPEYKQLTEAVYASGNLFPEKEYKVFAQSEGYIINKFVEDGDTVNENQALYQVESDVQNTRLKNAQEIYKMAEINYGESS